MVNKGCCTEWEQEVILFLDNELSEAGRVRCQKHLEQCKTCSLLYHETEQQEQLLGGRIRHQANVVFPSKAFTDTVMEELPSSQTFPLLTQARTWATTTWNTITDSRRLHLAAAASLLICVIGILAALHVGSVPEEQFIHIERNGVFSRYTLLEPIYVSHPDGEFFEFPDGSLAYASPGTWFTIDSYQEGSEDFAIGSDRMISLMAGELFFDVMPAREGFSVICSNSKTTVFGTQFYVTVNPGPDKKTIVAVREGQVFVEKRGRNQLGSTVLKDRQMTEVLSRDGNVILRPPHVIQYVLLARLDLFHNARSNRVARGLLPKSDAVIEKQEEELTEMPQPLDDPFK